MKVFTASVPIAGLANTPELESRWAESWSRFGWEPIVLSPSKGEFWDEVNEYASAIDCRNPPEYRNQCITRWVDFAEAGAGVMVDMDVLNFGWRPEDAETLVVDPTRIHGLARWCPCAIVASLYPVLGFIDFMSRTMTNTAAVNRLGGVIESDQEMFVDMVKNDRRSFSGHQIVRHYGATGWEDAELIHFATDSITRLSGGLRKIQVIRRFIRENKIGK